jgi:alpha-beta hydrolase superfamily lysophospholipase
MRSKAKNLLKGTALVLCASLFTLLAVRAWNAHRAPDLDLWHTFVPEELTGKEIASTDWSGYLAAEERIFSEVRAEVTDRLPDEARTPSNRYFAGSPIYPGRFVTDWNRSYVLEPAGAPAGAVVFLHGLTDSPYSLRHLARSYRDRGFVAVAPRMPAHGTVPAALAEIEWEDWSEATRLAVREARRRAGPGVPLHLVGFSNGGALAMKYALDAIGDDRLEQADRIVLIAPMIGITSFARFAGVFGWPAVLPAFAKAAWLGVVPEFNPFKYNSFPINGARQSSLLTRALQRRLDEYARDGRLEELPPVQTFQSLVDFTVSTRAIVTSLYANLPANGSELVLFDLNRNAKLGPLMRPGTNSLLARTLPAPPRRYRTTVITNASPGSDEIVEHVIEAGATTVQERALGLRYPLGVFSLSHLALPFPVSDPLYGMQPDDSEDFGVQLGALAMRGERGILIVSQDSLTRIASNPFFPYLLERIEQGTGTEQSDAAPVAQVAPVSGAAHP